MASGQSERGQLCLIRIAVAFRGLSAMQGHPAIHASIGALCATRFWLWWTEGPAPVGSSGAETDLLAVRQSQSRLSAVSEAALKATETPVECYSKVDRVLAFALGFFTAAVLISSVLAWLWLRLRRPFAVVPRVPAATAHTGYPELPAALVSPSPSSSTASGSRAGSLELRLSRRTGRVFE